MEFLKSNIRSGLRGVTFLVASHAVSAENVSAMRCKCPRKLIVMLVLTIFTSISPAQAGMTVYGLRDIYRLRFEEVSFFIVLLLVCAALFRLLWNHAVKGFTFLPRLKFRQSLCLSILLGLAMLLILAMISGIREVLTPGAWRHQGSSYRLNDPSQEPARRRSLDQLRTALFEYASHAQGRFPPHDFVPEISEKLWESPDQLGTHYIYSGGLTTNDITSMLAIEPINFGDQRFVLFVSGEIRQFSSEEIDQRLRQKVRP